MSTRMSNDSELVRELQDATLRYAVNRWRIFPCEPGGKRPLVKWRDEATDDPVLISLWWARWPLANIGVACGEASNLLVLDFDVKGGAPGAEAALEVLGARWWERMTYITTPSGGWHVYFSWRQAVELRAAVNAKRIPGLDIQGEGSYVLAPPSWIAPVDASGEVLDYVHPAPEVVQ